MCKIFATLFTVQFLIWKITDAKIKFKLPFRNTKLKTVWVDEKVNTMIAPKYCGGSSLFLSCMMPLSGVFLKTCGLNFMEYSQERRRGGNKGKRLSWQCSFFTVTTTCIHKYFTSAAFILVNLTAMLMQHVSL